MPGDLRKEPHGAGRLAVKHGDLDYLVDVGPDGRDLLLDVAEQLGSRPCKFQFGAQLR